MAYPLFARINSIGKRDRCSILLVAVGIAFILTESTIGTVRASSSDGEVSGTIESEPATSADTVATQKARETPHFWQRYSRGGFQNGGRDYCCPVAVSNSLVYLAHHGFPDLLPDGDGDQPQIDLINILASSDYFGTDPKNGTSPGEVLTGVQKYVNAKGYGCERIEYEGWRKIGKNNSEMVKAARPVLDWIKEGIRNPNGAVWLNIGWYKQLDQAHWKRTGGHWVTLVGYEGGISTATLDSTLFLIHNPATSGKGDRADNLGKDGIHLERVSEGTLDTGGNSTEDAAGMFQVHGAGLPMSKGVDAAFLDAAIVLVVKP